MSAIFHKWVPTVVATGANKITWKIHKEKQSRVNQVLCQASCSVGYLHASVRRWNLWGQLCSTADALDSLLSRVQLSQDKFSLTQAPCLWYYRQWSPFSLYRHTDIIWTLFWLFNMMFLILKPREFWKVVVQSDTWWFWSAHIQYFLQFRIQASPIRSDSKSHFLYST